MQNANFNGAMGYRIKRKKSMWDRQCLREVFDVTAFVSVLSLNELEPRLQS